MTPAFGDPKSRQHTDDREAPSLTARGFCTFGRRAVARTIAAIEAQMSATVIRRLAAKAAIRRRRDDAKRAEADVAAYQRLAATLGTELEDLFDERARAQMTEQVRVLSTAARILEAQS